MKTTIAALVGTVLLAAVVTPASAGYDSNYGYTYGHDYRDYDHKAYYGHGSYGYGYGYKPHYEDRYEEKKCFYKKVKVSDGYYGWIWKDVKYCY